MMFRTITIAALVGFVSANSYSIGCMNTLINIGQNPDVGVCLKPASLLPILIGLGNGPESMIGYLDTWLASMCGSPSCSDDTLNAVVTNLTNGCSAEFSLPQVQQSLNFVKANYKTARKVACLKDGQVSCVTGTLRNIESVVGTFNLQENNILAIAKVAKAGFPSSVLCTNCMKGAYTIINKAIPGSFSASDTKYATDTCGAAFADGGIPPGLISVDADPVAKPAPPATTTSITSTPTPSPTPTPTPTPTPSPKPKSAALGGPTMLSSGAFMAISALIVVSVGMV
jgi:hypothetical protein